MCQTDLNQHIGFFSLNVPKVKGQLKTLQKYLQLLEQTSQVAPGSCNLNFIKPAFWKSEIRSKLN